MKNLLNFRLLVLIGVLIMNVSQMWAGTWNYDLTFYCIPKEIFGSHAEWHDSMSDRKIRIDAQGQNGTYKNAQMTGTGKYYNGYEIYSVTINFTANDGGAAGASNIYIKLVPSDNWDYKYTELAWGAWKTKAEIDGSIRTSSGWSAYAEDKTIYVLDDKSFSSIYRYTFDPVRDGDWPGTNISTLGDAWYEVSIVGSAKYILNNNNDHQTGDLLTKDVINGRSYHFTGPGGDGKYGLEEKKFTASFNMQDHGSAISDQSKYYNEKFTEPSPAPSATGYTFGGWYDNSTCTGSTYDFDTPVTDDVELYAKWTPKTTTVTLDKNGATSGSNQTVTATYDAAMPTTTTSSTTVTAPSRTGYTFGGFYDTSASTGGTQYYTNAANPASARTWNKDATSSTLWARWTANNYNPGSNIDKNNSDAAGSSGGAYNVSYDATSITVSTTPTRKGYHIEGYYMEVGCTTKIANSDKSLVSATTTYTSGGQWKYEGAPTLYVKWESDWYMYGSTSELGAWTTAWAEGAMTYSASNRVSVTLTLTAGQEYQFKIWKTGGSAWSNSTDVKNITSTVSNKTLYSTDPKNMNFTASAGGNYTFTLDLTSESAPALTLTYPSGTTYTVTHGAVSFFGKNGATHETSTEGGSITVVDNYDKPVGSGKKVLGGGSLTFTAEPEDGYTFVAWFTNEDCTTGRNSSNPMTVSDIAANVTYYAKFTENMTSVSVHTYSGLVSIDGGEACEGTEPGEYIEVGVHTTATVAISSVNTGYYFSEWDLSAAGGEELNFHISGSATNEDNQSVTLTGNGAANSRLNFLYPKFKQLEMIYFRNEFKNGETVTKWDNVYVFFGTYWETYNAQNCVKTNSDNVSKGLHVQMTQVGSSNLYRAYVPRWATRQGWPNIAFANEDNAYNNSPLYACKAAGRGDYNKALNVYVPYHTPKYTNINSVDYYDDGFWMVKNTLDGEDAGYELYRRTGANSYTKCDGEFIYTSKGWETPIIQYRLRIDGADKDKYRIQSKAGTKYKANATITTAKCDDVRVIDYNGDNDAHFQISLTSQGEYILTIDQSADTMKLSVNYPIAVGDYILEHTYDNGSAKTTHSDVIKAAEASTRKIYSMYLSDEGTETLKLKKCEAISNTGVITWSDGDNTNLEGEGSVLDAISGKKGVYQFYLTIANDKVSTVDSIVKYSGDYYIKADSTKGGWAIYKNNPMAQNTLTFNASDPTTFDYYWCHYYYTNSANIKCVIANDYCNQLSDTLYSDGTARMVGTPQEPYVPLAQTNIRFSYNSATNTVKRSYLRASLNDEYLDIVPYASGYIANSSGEELYNASAQKRRFSDSHNWIYELDLKVKPGGKAGVSANYNSVTTYFLPTTTTLLGGEGSDAYNIHVTYDFKTNYLMSAFTLPEDGVISDALSDVDVLWIRHADDDPIQVSFTGSGALSDVKVVGAIELRYNELNWSSSDASWIDLSRWTPTNRPYLKYFISFPFNVPVASVFGLNEGQLGREYVIQKYNGTKRASEGLFFGDGDNYWENMTSKDTLHANEGYCVIFDNEYLEGFMGKIWENKSAGDKVYLYFPACNKMSITNNDQDVTVAAHTCTIDRAWSQDSKKNHKNTDSHWSMIGNPLFHNAYIKSKTDGDSENYPLESYYYLDYAANTWETQAITAGSTDFQAMSSVLVQWYGTIKWTKEKGPYSAPRRHADAQKNYLAELELSYNDAFADRTYIKLNENAVDSFLLREDMCKYYNKSKAQVYTFAGDYDVAYNGVPVKNQTIPVGLVARKNGTYTFSMPTEFSGTVTLIDKFDGTHTNLALQDYTVDLNKGTIDDRFELEINISKMPTAIDGAEDGSGSLKDGKAHKFIMNGVLYILNDGVLYDARGNRVQ